MERTDGLAVFDPTHPHRAVGMWATAQQRVENTAVVEDRDPQAINLDAERTPAAFHLARPANGNKIGHARKTLEMRNPKT